MFNNKMVFWIGIPNIRNILCYGYHYNNVFIILLHLTMETCYISVIIPMLIHY